MLEAQLHFRDRRLKPSDETDGPGHGADFDGVSSSLIAVPFGQDAEELKTPNAMLEADAEPAQSTILIAFILCQWSCLGLLTTNVGRALQSEVLRGHSFDPPQGRPEQCFGASIHSRPCDRRRSTNLRTVSVPTPARDLNCRPE